MNGQVGVTWQTLKTITHSMMIHERVSEKYIHFELIYLTDHILPVLPIKHLVNEDVEPTMPHKLATGMKPSVSNLRFLLCPCVVQKATTAHVDTKASNILHNLIKGFGGILIGTPQNKKGTSYMYLVLSSSTCLNGHKSSQNRGFMTTISSRFAKRLSYGRSFYWCIILRTALNLSDNSKMV